MKKILALVLALVMTMSLATISSGAAFSDADKVQYTDAVNTLNALGVIGGYADGSIRPQADVSRGAAAKMVAMVATGSNTNTLGYYAGTSSFTDVPGTHTFADAVAFCVARGIVAGYGNGLYGVADNVKGWAVAKMVLVAMGYDAKAYGLTGSGQDALNTITLATEVGLFNGMAADFKATEAASREECAQIVYNALNKATVEASMNSSTGVVTYTKSGAPLLSKYNVTLQANKSVIDMLPKGIVTANVATGASYTKIGNDWYNVETGLDLVGHKVAVVKKSAVAKYDAVAKVSYYDAFEVVDLSTVVEVAKEIKADTVKGEEKFDAAFGSGAIDASSVTRFGNYTVNSNIKSGFSTANHTAKAGTYVLYTDATGTSLVSYLTASSDIVVVKVTVTNAAKGYYKVGTASDDDAYKAVVATAANCYDNVVSAAEIDWLGMVAQNSSTAQAVYKVTACGTKFELAEVATVEGKVTKVNTTAGSSAGVTDGEIYIDGVKYGYSDNDATAAGVLYATAISDEVLPGFTASYKFYLDQNGEVFAYTALTAEDTNAYSLAYVMGSRSYVTGTSAFGNEMGYTIQYYTLDGAVNAETYYSWNGNKIVAANAQSGEVVYDVDTNGVDADEVSGWVLIAKTAEGAVVKALTSNYTTTTVTAGQGGASTMATKLGNYFITSKSAFVYSGANSFDAANVAASVKTGAHLNTIAQGTDVSVVYANSTENATGYEVVAAWVPTAIAATEKEFAYVVSYNGAIGKTADGLRDLYSWTVVDKAGEYKDIEVVTAYSDSKLYDWFEIVTASATGYVSIGDEYADGAIYRTDDTLAGASVYTVNGVTYWNDGTTEYVATSKILDMRAGVYTGALEAVESIADAAALGNTAVIRGVYTYDAATYTSTLVYMIIEDVA